MMSVWDGSLLDDGVQPIDGIAVLLDQISVEAKLQDWWNSKFGDEELCISSQ
jgi:hypothetical protein